MHAKHETHSLGDKGCEELPSFPLETSSFAFWLNFSFCGMANVGLKAKLLHLPLVLCHQLKPCNIAQLLLSYHPQIDFEEIPLEDIQLELLAFSQIEYIFLPLNSGFSF